MSAQQEKRKEHLAFLVQVRKNPAILNSTHPDIVHYYKEKAGIVDSKNQPQTSSARMSNRGLGISIGIDENSNLDQVVDFAFRLQIMKNNGAINQEFWQIAAESIQVWLLDKNLNWTSFLESMRERVAA
jgi:hypothetical protein